MAQSSSIEWTEATWNPLLGCTKISPGCKHCYAERFAERWRGIPSHPFEFGFEPRLVPSKLTEPLRWRTPKTVFVNSMSDLFLEGVPLGYLSLVCEVMQAARWHTFQVLTKRAERMRALLSGELSFAAELDQIWWGVSVEDRRFGLPRIEQLQRTPVSVRFLSIEPLLDDLGPLDLRGIDWVIVGGESGPGARPMEASWVRSIRDQCQEQGARFFFKQWGGVQKKAAGRTLDGQLYEAMPLRKSIPALPDRARRQALIAFEEKAKAFVPLVKLGRQAREQEGERIQDELAEVLEEGPSVKAGQQLSFGGIQ